MTGPEWRDAKIAAYRSAVRAIAEAKVRYANEFLSAKLHRGTSDGQAHQQAVIATNGELDVLQAELVLAERDL